MTKIQYEMLSQAYESNNTKCNIQMELLAGKIREKTNDSRTILSIYKEANGILPMQLRILIIFKFSKGKTGTLQVSHYHQYLRSHHKIEESNIKKSKNHERG